MSKDFRPCDLFNADKHLSLRDARFELKNVNTGESVPMVNEEARTAYPEMSFLFACFDQLYEKNKGNEKALSVFAEFESALKKEETTFQDNHFFEKSSGLSLYKEYSLEHVPVEDVVREWFYGRLDSHFYYNEINNQALYDYMLLKLERT